MDLTNFSLINLYILSMAVTGITFICGCGFFSVLAHILGKHNPNLIKYNQTNNEWKSLLITFPVMNLGLVILFWGSSFLNLPLYFNTDFWPLIITFGELILFTEFQYYLVHRFLHTSKLMKSHARHHQATTVRPLSGMHFDFFEVFFVNLCLPLPFFFIFASFTHVNFWGICLYNLGYFFTTGWLHSNIKLPEWLRIVFNNINLTTSSDHANHHSKFNGNYGLYSMFLDKLFGTYFEEDTKQDKDKPSEVVN